MEQENVFLEFYRTVKNLIVPGLKYSQTIYENVLSKNIIEGCTWLELGCGHHILPPWRFDQEKKLADLPKLLIGFDYDYLALKKHKTITNKIRGHISRLPFPDNTFDVVTSNMVFEHLRSPSEQLIEVHRVLKSGGMLIFHTPNALGYSVILTRVIPDFIKGKLINFLQNRIEEDVFPTYYRINTPSKIMAAARGSGFVISNIKLIASEGQLVMIPPLIIPELIWIRLSMRSMLKKLRTNIIACLIKTGSRTHFHA